MGCLERDSGETHCAIEERALFAERGERAALLCKVLEWNRPWKGCRAGQKTETAVGSFFAGRN